MSYFKQMFFHIKNNEYRDALEDRLTELEYTRAVDVFLNRGDKYVETNTDGYLTFVACIPDGVSTTTLDELYETETGKRFVSHMGRIHYIYGFEE